jgi:hypothetical protein
LIVTVPPNQPPRPSDEAAPRSESPSAPPAPDTTDAALELGRSAASPVPEHAQPVSDATPASPPASTYLSGIVTAGLAAVCGAIFTSWAGVQGTLVGAMIGATIGSSVSEIVRAPLDSLERRLVAAGFSVRRLRRDGVVKTVATSPVAAQQAFGMISKGAIVTVGATAIVGFLLAVGGVTAVEVAAGEPLAAMVADAPATGTTIGNALPDPPPVLAPAPGGPAAGRSGGGVTAARPADPILGSEDPAVAASPSATATQTATDDAQNTNTAASPSPASGEAASVSASPDAATQAAEATGTTTPDALTPTATGSTTIPTTSTTPTVGGSATATIATSPSAVRVVTVVVTATPTATAAGAPQAAGVTSASAPVVIQTATPTPTWTPTPTPTSTSSPTVVPGT